MSSSHLPIVFILNTFLGFGKSLVYQLAPLVYNIIHSTTSTDSTRKVIIIEPTIALIQDSIHKLKELCPSFSAVHLTAATVSKTKTAAYIFSSPEMLLSDISRNELLTNQGFISTVDVVFIDECHIIEQW